jgi:hypothetical protein
MAIGIVTHVSHRGESPMDPTFHDVVSFPGPAAVGTFGGYTTGGDTGLLAALRALTGQPRTILSAVCVNGGGYHAEYIQATDLVIVYGTGAANKAVGTQPDAHTDLAGTTFVFEIHSK